MLKRDDQSVATVRQLIDTVAIPRLSLQPVPASREKVQDTMLVRAAAPVHAEDRRMASEAGNLPGQCIASRHTPPEPTDARASFAHQARHRWLRDPEFPLNLLPAQEPTFPQDPEESIQALHRPLRIAF